jgi:hypothetical protein
LVIIQAQTLVSELLAQYAVLFLEVIDYVALVLVQPPGERNQQQAKGIECQTYGGGVASCCGLRYALDPG